MKRFAFILLALAALFFACRKNIDEIDQQEKGPIPTVNVESTLIGRVLDANGNPIAGVNIAVAGLSLISNQQGLFFVAKRLLDSNGTYVTASKTGFFDAARFAFPHLSTTGYLEIQLLPKELTLAFDAASGANINIGTGATTSIPANAIVDANGTSYQGMVHAYAVWLDPTKPETFRTMPGDLRAIDSGGFAKLLETYGMVGVELESPSGDKLNIASGQKAKISLPVPAALQGTAPASIPLWHFNTVNGYWEEEGSATLLNGKYEGEVSHFSFWNCDYPTAFVKLTVCFNNSSNVALSNLVVTVKNAGFGAGTGITDGNGLVNGLVPNNQILTLTVKDACGNIAYQDNIGPFSADVNLGKITIDVLATALITGNLVDCNNNPISNGVVLAVNSSHFPIYASADANGNFSIAFQNCLSGGNYTVTGYNPTDLTQSAPQPLTLTGTSINIGTIPVCTALNEYAVVTTGGVSKTYPLGLDFTLQNIAGSLSANDQLTDSANVFLAFQILDPNSTDAVVSFLQFSRYENNIVQIYGCEYCAGPGCGCAASDIGPITFTSFPAVIGDYAIGSVSGNVLSHATNTLVPFTLTFRLKRRH